MTRLSTVAFASLFTVAALPALAADTASGTVNVDKMGRITVSKAVAYPTRDPRNARVVRTEILLTDVAVDGAAIRADLDPHVTAINVEPLRDRNYVILGVDADGSVWMNATFSKTMTQYVDTAPNVKITWTQRTPTRLEGRLYTEKPVKTMDGDSYSVDLKFGVDVPPAATGEALPAAGGEPGKAFMAFWAAAQRKNWNAFKATLGPEAKGTFERDYNTPAENAESALDLLKAWLPTINMKVARGTMRSDTVAILEVEGEKFAGMGWLSIVEMVKEGTAWKFNQAVPGGSLPKK